MPGRRGQGKAALGPLNRRVWGRGTHRCGALFRIVFGFETRSLVSPGYPGMCILGWSWTQKSPFLFYFLFFPLIQLGLKLLALQGSGGTHL